MSDYEFSDEYCPNCGAVMHIRGCSELYCENGYVNRYEEDPLWYDEDDCEQCEECHGMGYQEWCPKCGHDHALYRSKLAYQEQPDEASEVINNG